VEFKILRKYASLKHHPNLGEIITQLEAHLDKQETIYYAKNCVITVCLMGTAIGAFLQGEHETFTHLGAYLERQIEEEQNNATRHEYYQFKD
jgi:hypothetical protein